MKKQTKIVATIGPSSMSVEKLSHMMEAGMNVCRLNFSHSEHAWHAECVRNIRDASQKTGKTVAIVADLQGPRIRTYIRDDIDISNGEEILLVEKEVIEAGGKGIGVDQPEILPQLKEGKQILIEDGKIVLESLRMEDGAMRCRVISGGRVKNHKGMNFPGAQLKLPVLTPKDKKDVEFSLEQGVDYIALSFIGFAEDIVTLRKLMREIAPQRDYYPMIIPKIERQDALENLDDIIREADAVMVARGDLGIEVEGSKVAILQKEIIEKCLFQVKPVIVATQMLESMMENLRPLRAEVSDVSNAVIDHADATMLSGETAGGKHPVEVVQMMTDIITSTEESRFDDVYGTLDMRLKTKYAHMVRGVYEFAKSNNVDAILATSTTGYTARLLSHFRPSEPIYIATEQFSTHRQLSLVWGTQSFLFEGNSDEDHLIELLVRELVQRGDLHSGDEVVTVSHATVKLQKVK